METTVRPGIPRTKVNHNEKLFLFLQFFYIFTNMETYEYLFPKSRTESDVDSEYMLSEVLSDNGYRLVSIDMIPDFFSCEESFLFLSAIVLFCSDEAVLTAKLRPWSVGTAEEIFSLCRTRPCDLVLRYGPLSDVQPEWIAAVFADHVVRITGSRQIYNK